MNYNSLFPQTIFVSLNYCCWLEQCCTDKCHGFSVKFTEQPSNMQKHAFLCQRNCIYVYVTRKVYHGIRCQMEVLWIHPVDTGFSVLADLLKWHSLCVTCPLLLVLCVNCLLWPYIASGYFLFDNRFVCRSVWHLSFSPIRSVTPMHCCGWTSLSQLLLANINF